ncbi:MAG: Mut7-C RNAse domain-containing protein [Candidatus Bathyarchaeota archaeon]|nr:Mut7-C RNAse domain-containing protein [Candidatus Bathyarchaeota archaeon]
MKFIADGMLGKLARWLRMLGQDVKYSNSFEDDKLIAIAQEEHRVLLTRDLELYRRAIAKGLVAFYVEGQTEAARLSELAKRFNIPLAIDMTRSRCPKCNTKIQPVPKEALVGKVEKNTFDYYEEFWRCPNCGNIYWQGAHWARIRTTLEEARKLKAQF